MVIIDEAHKIFDRMPDYRLAFDYMKQLHELPCPLVAMSATLTSSQVDRLKEEYVRGDQSIVLTKGVNRDNLQLRVQRYRRRKLHGLEKCMVDEDGDKENDSDPTISASNDISVSSMWTETMSRISSLFEGHSTVLYLDFVKDVEMLPAF